MQRWCQFKRLNIESSVWGFQASVKAALSLPSWRAHLLFILHFSTCSQAREAPDVQKQRCRTLPGEVLGPGTSWALAARGWREDREPLHHLCLPNTVPLLALRKYCLVFAREIKIISRQIEAREERKGGGKSKGNTISRCSMNVSRGPFSRSLSSSLSLPSHPLSRQLAWALERGEGDALGENWI